MFRDQTGAARASIALIFLAFALAALARRPVTAPATATRSRQMRLRAGMLLLSGLALVVGIAWAFDAHVTVMGRGQAPAVTGSVSPTPSGGSLDAHVLATGVKSSNRIVVLAFASSRRARRHPEHQGAALLLQDRPGRRRAGRRPCGGPGCPRRTCRRSPTSS